jgi:DoxX-like family
VSAVLDGVVLLTAVANTGFAIADFVRAKFVLATSAEVQVPTSWLPMLGLLKLAGALGLFAGLVGVPVVGPAAAAGLTLFFIGAVTRHIQTRVFHNIAFPASVLLVSVASLVVTLRW